MEQQLSRWLVVGRGEHSNANTSAWGNPLAIAIGTGLGGGMTEVVGGTRTLLTSPKASGMAEVTLGNPRWSGKPHRNVHGAIPQQCSPHNNHMGRIWKCFFCSCEMCVYVLQLRFYFYTGLVYVNSCSGNKITMAERGYDGKLCYFWFFKWKFTQQFNGQQTNNSSTDVNHFGPSVQVTRIILANT